jgi:RNA polymerase primary sigma factor
VNPSRVTSASVRGGAPHPRRGRGRRRARAALVDAFLPLIGSVARNYRASRQVTRVELMQEGVVGPLRALERYDPSLGTPSWAYAS